MGEDKKPGLGSETLVIQWRIPAWFPELPSDILEKLKKYHSELLKFNKTTNLISVKTIGNADAVHIADCIYASRIIANDASFEEVFDFGSGGGCPGLIFAILYPSVKVHLVDNDEKKVEFLKHCVAALHLSNAAVINKSIEGLLDSSVKFAFCRGFSSISKAILMGRKIFPKGGVFYHIKGEEWATEIGQIPTQLCSYWMPSLVSEYKIPSGPVKYAVVKTEKIAD